MEKNVPIDIKNITCQNEGHSASAIMGFCIDEKCTEENKFICVECIFDNHPQHKMIRIKELDDMISKGYEKYKKSKEEEKVSMDLYSKNAELDMKKMEVMKVGLMQIIDEKINLFRQDLMNKYKLINCGDNKFEQFKELEGIMDSNAAPTTRLDIAKLSKICNNIYNQEKNSYNKENVINESIDKDKIIKKSQKLLDSFNKEFDKYLSEQLNQLEKFCNNNFFKIPNNFMLFNHKFEWSEKTYDSYDFYYELNDTKTKGTKNSTGGTMTILRAKEKLEKDNKYFVQFKLGMHTGGDFYVGIGNDKVGSSCWLRTKNSISVFNEGVYTMENLIKTNIKRKDEDIVNFEISIEKRKNNFKAFINNDEICCFDFYIAEDIYIMAAIRNIGNSIEVIKYEVCLYNLKTVENYLKKKH